MSALEWLLGGVVVGALAKVLTAPKATGSSPLAALPATRDFGVLPALTTGRVWPVASGLRAVPYTTPAGVVVGNAATAFHASREDGTRFHAGVDLQASPGQRVLAMEGGVVLGTIPGFVQLDAIVVQHRTVIAVYAEVALGSLTKAGLAPGALITAGQWIASGSINKDGNSMLHLELWQPGFAPKSYTPWYQGKPAPRGLLDPTRYLLALAKS